MEKTVLKKRIQAVDYIKCLACFLILNSHIAPLYPDKLKALSFGGFFGNCLFFFVSGFCLLNVKESFPKWYWKRFVRVISPYWLMIPLLFFDGRFSGSGIINVIMPFKLYHFIPTILILYIAFYTAVILNRHKIHFHYLIIGAAVISFLFFYCAYDYNTRDIYEHFTFLEMLSYFVTMLAGAIVSKSSKVLKWYIYLAAAVVFFGLYGYQSVFGFPKVISIFQLIIGIGFSCSLACLFVSL